MTPQRNDDPLRMLRVLYVYWRILGLCPFVPVEGEEMIRSSYLGIVYTIIIMLGYLVAYVRVIVNRMNFILWHESAMSVISDFAGQSIEYLVIVSAWLCFAFRQNKLRIILKTLKNIHETSKKIGIEQDFENIVKTIKMNTFLVNLIWAILLWGDYIILVKHKAFELASWISFNVPRVVTGNLVVMFACAMLVVKKFFYLLNENINDLSMEETLRPCVIVKRNRRASENCRLKFGTPGPLEVYGQMHSDLVTLTKMIVDFFSLSIILALLVDFIRMATDLYLACLLAKDLGFLVERGKLPFVLLCSWFGFRFVQTVVLIAISDSTAYEANRTGSVLHTMLTSGRPKKYLDLAQVLSFRLLQRCLNIKLYGMLEMRLSVLYGIIGMVGTYITIMMQLDTPEIQQNIDGSYEEKFGLEAEPSNITIEN